MERNSIRIAVVSDLHVYSDNVITKNRPSSIKVAGEKSPLKNPIEGLSYLISQENIQADFLVCAGDLCDKADPEGLRYGWELLNKIKEELGAENLYATAGNHDLDSRGVYTSYDAREEIQSLTPRHPVDIESKYDKYWSRHYTILEHENIRFLLLNSAAYHGIQKEFEHGRVSPKTIARIKTDLTACSEKVNILLVHHHPHRHQEINHEDYSSMQGGEQLIDTLTRADVGPWLIIHGHKHIPTICYSASSCEPAVVFAAGSFSASLYDEIQGIARNQFYIIEIDCNPSTISKDLFMAGKFSAWDWIHFTGWQKARSALPAQGGFGARVVTKSLASDIAQLINNSGSSYLRFTEVKQEFPQISYLLPDELMKLKNCLEKHAVYCTDDGYGAIIEMGKKV